MSAVKTINHLGIVITEYDNANKVLKTITEFTGSTKFNSGQFHVPPETFVPPVMDVFIDLRPRVGTWASPYKEYGMC